MAVPVYLSPPSVHLTAMVADLRARVAAGAPPTNKRQAGYRVVVKGKEAMRPLPAATVENYHALLGGMPSAAGSRPPTVALVAHYDTLALAPGAHLAG